MNTIGEIRAELTTFLAAHGIEKGEAKAMADETVMRIKGYKPIDLALYPKRELLPGTVAKMRQAAQAVADGEPLQYALGVAHFRGRDFAVSPAVLIPRPETAGLVDMVADDLNGRRDCRILDVGTGSGCIAISLALDIPFAQVDATDISKPALEVAKGNAKALNAKVDFFEIDTFALSKSQLKGTRYDAIVANPPYILNKERASMEVRVSEKEPAIALFVPDSDPLLHYRAIAEFAKDALAPGGKLYFEINPLCAKELKDMLAQMGYQDIDILPDYKGTLRFATATP